MSRNPLEVMEVWTPHKEAAALRQSFLDQWAWKTLEERKFIEDFDETYPDPEELQKAFIKVKCPWIIKKTLTCDLCREESQTVVMFSPELLLKVGRSLYVCAKCLVATLQLVEP